MKRYLTLSTMTLGLSLSAYGSTACSSLTTFQDYINATACSAGAGPQSYTLNDFTFLGVSLLTAGTSPADIDVSTTVGANGPVVVFAPDAKFNVNSTLAATELVLFGFDITSNNANIMFNNVILSEQSLLTGLSTGLVAEEDCYGGALPTPSNVLSLGNGGLACLSGGISVGTSVGNSLLLGAGNNANANVNLQTNKGPVSSVDVLKEISLTGLLGGASITGIGQSFNTVNTSATPEPTSLFLGGCGLIMLAIARPRKWKKDSQR